MSYTAWFEAHGKKHAQLVARLRAQGLGEEAIIDYFAWEKLHVNEPQFCPLFKEGKQCHDMEALNCYLCACPNFRFNDNAPHRKSHCAVDSKESSTIESHGITHQNCSRCTVPHHRSYVKRMYHTDWFIPMKACNVKREV